MPSRPSRSTCAVALRRRQISLACSLVATLVAAPLRAQDESAVQSLASVLSVEDARRYDASVLTRAAHDADPSVRRHAALAIGRIGNRAGVRILLELLTDPDTTVQADAAFALGLVGDPSVLPRLREFVLNTPADQQVGAHAEAAAAIARIGGPEAAKILTDLLDRWSARARDADFPISVTRALSEAWRLKGAVPAQSIMPFVESPFVEARWRAMYSLSRLRSPEAADLLLRAADDQEFLVRSLAARALTAQFADTSGLDRDAVAARVRRLTSDDSTGVRINALQSLATFASPAYAPVAIERLSDANVNVRVQALATLGSLGGAEAEAALRDNLTAGNLASRRQALVSLARVARGGAIGAIQAWAADTAWNTRRVAAQALAATRSDSAIPLLERLAHDADGRVAHTALSGALALDSAHAPALAREMCANDDPIVRAVAAGWMRQHPDTADITPLVQAYQRALSDALPDARESIVGALGAIAGTGFDGRIAVEDRFLDRVPVPTDYLVRRVAAERYPAAAERWGPERPVVTGREMGDYRDIARSIVYPADHGGVLPRIVIETDRGSITIQLYAGDAPITVRAFLFLIDRRYFDGGDWHRVVPNFVVQDGDPRGDGEGGPGYTLRDEVSRQPYDPGVVGMALSGPDTGGSQFFIALDPEPRLEGTYPAIGRVLSGMDVVSRISQGDRIRRIRRAQ